MEANPDTNHIDSQYKQTITYLDATKEKDNMLEPPLTAEARLALNRYSSDNPIRTLLPLWRQFEDFLQSHSRMPASILEIPEDTLRAYASYLDYRDCHVDDALVALSAVLLVCLNAGYSGKVLRTIVIPRIRRPVENRQWDAFRLRTYQPLESSQLARSRRRRAKREACAQDAARPDNALM